MGDTGDFGKRLRRLRLAAGLTQEALADLAHISSKALSELERDPHRTPRLVTVGLLADALRLDEWARRDLLAAARSNEPMLNEGFIPETRSRSVFHAGTPLIGRSESLDVVVTMVRQANRLGESRLITLIGPGGVGKTRLALAVADLAAGDFANGAAFVDLASVPEPALVLPTIARHFSLGEQGPTPLPARLVAALRLQRLLLVLDNFEHVLDAREEVRLLLDGAPFLVVLTTSRAPLHLRVEQVYRVPPLAIPDSAATREEIARAPAVELFLERGRATGAKISLDPLTAAAVAEICRRVDGLPLALELAAAWCRVLTPAALAARLDPVLPLLTEGSHDLPIRQRTMRNTIAWSYERLTASEQQCFRCLSSFAGGCTLAAAEAVCGGARDDSASGVFFHVVALMDRGLARPDERGDEAGAETRLGLLETLREFGWEQALAHGEADVLRQRQAVYFLAWIESQPALLGGDGESEHVLSRERGNIRLVLDWAIQRGDGETALRMVAALWRAWLGSGILAEGRRWAREALALAPANPTREQAVFAVRAFIGLAQLSLAQGAFDAARAPAIEATRSADRLGLIPERIDALNTQARIARERGEYHEAIQHYEEALRMARAIGDVQREAETLTGLGVALTFNGDLGRGMEIGAAGLALVRGRGEISAFTNALISLAGTMTHLGAFERAEALGEEALAAARTQGNSHLAAEAAWLLGSTAFMQDRQERALHYLEEDLALRRERGDELGMNRTLTAMALIELRRGAPALANTLISEARAITDRYDDPWAHAMGAMVQGFVHLAWSELLLSARQFSEAARIFTEIANPLYVPWCLEGFAGIAAASDNWPLAATLCGAWEGVHSRFSLGISAAIPGAFSELQARGQTVLGPASYGIQHTLGRELSIDQAIALGGALGISSEIVKPWTVAGSG